MDNVSGDILFYLQNIPPQSTVLELGCGTGRISNALASTCSVTGLDLSFAMLRLAKKLQSDSPQYVCMDMTQMAFNKSFDHILIPYNTLNLLGRETLIIACLQQAANLLTPHGNLLFQLYIPDEKLIKTDGQKTFQFSIFPLKENKGKLIKETIRCYSHDTERITLEERYRLRLSGEPAKKEDFFHVMHLAGFSLDRWCRLLTTCGFKTFHFFSDSTRTPFIEGQHTLLLGEVSLF